MLATLFRLEIRINLWELGENSEGSAASPFDLHWDREDGCALCRQTIQRRNVLEDRHIGAAEYLMNDEIARWAVIDARGIDANGFDGALFYEKLHRFFRKSWEMKIGYVAWFIGAEVLLAITPIFTPSRVHQNNGILRNAPETLLPGMNVLEV